jgi:hypothetical protein
MREEGFQEMLLFLQLGDVLDLGDQQAIGAEA